MQFIKKRKYHDVEFYRFGYSIIGKPYISVYTYLVDDILIDTAQRNCEKLVIDTFENKKIKRILLTHWHEDHTGNASKLAEMHQAEVFAHPYTAEKLKSGFDVFPYEKYLFGKLDPYKSHVHNFEHEIVTKNHRLIPIFTPGHSADHTVFYEPNKGWLFSGDLFVGIKIRLFKKGEEFWQQVESIKKILNYDFDVLFCGHHPRLKDGKQHLRAKLEYFENFGEKVNELAQKGMNSKEIMKEMRIRDSKILKLLFSNDVSAKFMVEAAIKTNVV